MRLLSLDIGRHHTGIAFYDDATGIPLPLDTITHESVEALVDHVHALIRSRSIDRIIIGLPLLPSGEEGEQVSFVREIGSVLASAGIPLSYVDERYTTPRASISDGNAAAACSLLQIALHKSLTNTHFSVAKY